MVFNLAARFSMSRLSFSLVILHKSGLFLCSCALTWNYRFNGYAIGEEHRQGCRVAALMPCDVLGDAATLGDGSNSVQAGHVMGGREYPAVFTQSPGIFGYPLWGVQQGGGWRGPRLPGGCCCPLVASK